MSVIEPINTFDAAVVAFEIRFERELLSRWEKREQETAMAFIDVSPAEKRDLLEQCFDEINNELAALIREYFPKLLRIATRQREHLGNQSPLTWTQERILSQVCNCLRMDGEFSDATEPRDDSLVLRTAYRLIANPLFDDDGSSNDFLLPWWADTRNALVQFLAGGPLRPPSGNEAETLSRAETLDYVKRKEFSIWKRIGRQCENESFEGVIEAGQTGISVLEAFNVQESQASTDAQQESTDAVVSDNRFQQEGDTWAIVFAGETCRLPALIIGLRYISVLLHNPGKPIRALDLQRVAGGLSMAIGRTADKSTRDESGEDLERGDITRQVVMDEEYERNIKRRMAEIERQIGYRDAHEVKGLQAEYDELESHLKKSRNVHGRRRIFSGENEKARMSVSKALDRAYEKIRPQAPETAKHLASYIKRGSVFMYRDSSIFWN